MTKQVKSRERVAEHGEVFTAEREVNAMLDLVKQETERVDSRFLEPACGDGNFVAEILRRKLEAAKKRAIPPRKKKPLPLLEAVTITDVAAEGKALARVDDMVVFVPFCVPGDVVDIQLKKKRKKS